MAATTKTLPTIVARMMTPRMIDTRKTCAVSYSIDGGSSELELERLMRREWLPTSGRYWNELESERRWNFIFHLMWKWSRWIGPLGDDVER